MEEDNKFKEYLKPDYSSEEPPYDSGDDDDDDINEIDEAEEDERIEKVVKGQKELNEKIMQQTPFGQSVGGSNWGQPSTPSWNNNGGSSWGGSNNQQYPWQTKPAGGNSWGNSGGSWSGSPGYFEMDIKKGETIVFAASTSEIKAVSLKKLFDKEVDERSPRDNFFHCLVNAAHQFHRREKNDDRYILAGYPWFKCRARDTFIALPGLTLSIEEDDYFELVMKTAMKGYYEFMEGKPVSVHIAEIEQPDVPLWAIWALQQYAKETSKEECFKKYGQFIKDVISFIQDNKHPNLKLEENGLLYTDGKDKAVTWMNSTANGRPVVPRTGYIVEFNALWYNALCFCASLAATVGEEDSQQKLLAQAELTKQAFLDTFLNEYGYLYDYVDGNMMDWSVRPNMIFAVAFDYSPLSQDQKKQVLDICTRELLTPKGLRSLSPKSGGYNPVYVGPQTQRDYAYHQGTAWPWLGGFYMEASLKLYKRTRLSFIERQMVGYEDEMSSHCLGTISELFDGNPPFAGRGAISFAMNVAEILRALELLEKYQY
jgi:glycogen debranching enzyme